MYTRDTSTIWALIYVPFPFYCKGTFYDAPAVDRSGSFDPLTRAAVSFLYIVRAKGQFPSFISYVPRDPLDISVSLGTGYADLEWNKTHTYCPVCCIFQLYMCDDHSTYRSQNLSSILSPSCFAVCGHHLSPRIAIAFSLLSSCLLYTSPSPRDRQKSRMPSSA